MNIAKQRPFAALFAAAWIALAAVACTTQPTPRSGDTASLEDRARLEERNGNLRVAAELYRQLADTVSGSARAGYLLQGAELAAIRDDFTAATAWLGEAETVANAAQRQAIVVLLADIDLRQDRAANALARLDQLREPIPVPVMTDAASVRGRALFDLGRREEAVRALAERETWLDSSEEILENQRMIWDGLGRDADALFAETGDPLVDGWLALAPIAASSASGAELRRALLDWRRDYANHPAAGGLLGDLLSDGSEVEAFPAQIALLLPISSPQRSLAVAIRDGFLAAHFSARNRGGPGGDSIVHVYDTGLLGAQEAYNRAQLEGADFIVGPLLRPEVDEIITQVGFVPTLALNFVDADTAFLGNFYQFALWPEHEAQAVARQAFASGARTAIALVPSNTLGYRLLNSFTAEFEALGGQFLGFNGYEPTAQDFSAPVESLLNLDRSGSRRTRLAANLGVGLAFEPRRRQDVDMIFIGADRRAGRLLAPALRYHFAGDIPTYATSDIYEPGAAVRDADLNDIYFPDAPWLLMPDEESADLRRTLEGFWPQRMSSSSIRLYGMGVDAYSLAGALFRGSTQWPIEGVSGQLELDASGRVNRMLPFAQFRNGQPVALEPSLQIERRRIEQGIDAREELARFQ